MKATDRRLNPGPKNYWTEERANDAIRDLARQFGRMPSASEVKATIGMGIKGALFKRGLWKIANELGLEIKDSDSKFGVRIQVAEAARLRDLGFYVEEHEHHQAPFDLLAGGVRVDCKAAHYKEYRHPNGHTISAGYFFALNKVPATCDLYLLVCEGGHRDGERYYIPASAAQQRMITITPTGRRFAAYRNALDVLIAMAADKTA